MECKKWIFEECPPNQYFQDSESELVLEQKSIIKVLHMSTFLIDYEEFMGVHEISSDAQIVIIL